MAKFGTNRQPFGQKPKADDDGEDDRDNGEGLPTPHTQRLAVRRQAGLAEARAILAHIPADNESVHAICTARFDLTDVVAALLERIGKCDSIRIATLGYNDRNLNAILRWVDAGNVKSVTLLASIFFRSHKGDLWAATQREFAARKLRTACCHSHSKVVTLSFAHGQKYSIEGSANLCGNGSGREQLALVNSHELHDWHAAWIEEMVTRHVGRENQTKEAHQATRPANDQPPG